MILVGISIPWRVYELTILTELILQPLQRLETSLSFSQGLKRIKMKIIKSKYAHEDQQNTNMCFNQQEICDGKHTTKCSTSHLLK